MLSTDVITFLLEFLPVGKLWKYSHPNLNREGTVVESFIGNHAAYLAAVRAVCTTLEGRDVQHRFDYGVSVD